MSMRPLPQKRQPSLVAKALGLALAPAFYGLQLSSGVVGFGVKQATAMLQLPLRILVTMLTLADALICDVLVMLSKQPGLRAQLQASQEHMAELQLVKQAQEHQIALLQSELDSLKMARSKSQRKQLELSQQLQRLRQLVSLQSRDAGAAAAAYDSPTAAGPTGKVFAQDGGAVDGGSQQQQAGAGAAAAYGVPGGSGFDNGSGSYAAGMAPGAHGDGGGSGRAEYGHVPARGWYLHACVVAAALGVRWWLLNQTDPLQRKVMLVIIWPALWAYGALVFRCVPNSYTLRASLACTCWALLGYVAHEMVSASVRTGPGH